MTLTDEEAREIVAFVKRMATCERCGGTGNTRGRMSLCARCDGSGSNESDAAPIITLLESRMDAGRKERG